MRVLLVHVVLEGAGHAREQPQLLAGGQLRVHHGRLLACHFRRLLEESVHLRLDGLHARDRSLGKLCG